MDTIKFNKANVRMVAHRGASGLERENTNAAFVAAGNRSYFGIETDVRKTWDGKYVLFHDGITERLCNVNFEIEKTEYDALSEIVINDLDGKPRSDLKIPLLEEYIKICKKYGKAAVLELKSGFTEREILEIVQIIEGQSFLENVIFISFFLDNLVLLKKHYENQPAQFLTGEWKEGLIELLKEHRLDLDIHYQQLNEDNVKKLKEAGIKINCWTCDDKEAAQRLANWGVDFITSNILE